MLETNQHLLSHGRDNSNEVAKREGVQVTTPVFVHPSATIEDAQIAPNVSNGRDCVVRGDLGAGGQQEQQSDQSLGKHGAHYIIA